jgi:hypothetical protein
MGADGTPDNVNFALPDPSTFASTTYGEQSGTLTLTSAHGDFSLTFAGNNPEDNVPNETFQSAGGSLVIDLTYTGEYFYTVSYPGLHGAHQDWKKAIASSKRLAAAAPKAPAPPPPPPTGTAPPTGVTGPFLLSVRPCIGCP